MFLGLACEGVSDYAVIENILSVKYDIDEFDFNRLQPHLDETALKQKSHGGWNALIDYLQTLRFHEDLINCSYLILQIDSDISTDKKFNVPHIDEKNEPLSPQKLIENITKRLIEVIEEKNKGLYYNNTHKIIFCICIHSIECWVLPFHNKVVKKHKTVNCSKELARLIGIDITVASNKGYELYKEISISLADIKNQELLKAESESFDYFIRQIENAN